MEQVIFKQSAMSNVTENSTVQIQELLIRMQRNNNIIQRLSKKLNSYTCEPNNHSCFEKLYELKHSFKVFASQQNQIMQLVKQKKGIAKNLQKDIQLHLDRFKQLERDMAAYLLDTNQYS
ncbi:hypothetical protein FVB32_13920 [Flagellimonas hymeniacidonis]|uniref:Uncharacterized protein n=1 Tax=Flagellimonas hymeniacidonis TaxID=2603628 RepID=A0A5C8V2W9_9FLAO|nr:hypothetical protein [Flagellimonas hymeniacidonis]TXN35671.1 hypothetical protein FVB32_13920 [Flagellimonas hymeniacidonis]